MLRRSIAEQLAELLFVVRDAVSLDQREEIGWRIARQRRPAVIDIVREKVLGLAVNIGEVAATAARDANLLTQFWGVLDQQATASTLSGDCSAHHPGRAGADDDDV